jgi:PAS domain S-box-containing protein
MYRNLKIRTKILLSSGILMACIVALGITYTLFITRQTLIDEYQRHLVTTALSRAQGIVQVADNFEKNAEIIALSVSSSTSQGQLQAIQKEQETVEKIQLVGRSGIILNSSNKSEIDTIHPKSSVLFNTSNTTAQSDLYEVNGSYFFDISSPIQLDATTSGVLVVQTHAAPLFSILTEHTGWGATGETYLVNPIYTMISPSRFVSDAPLRQQVNTHNARTCFSNKDNTLFPITLSDDYRGVSIIGTHIYLPEYNWCLLAEIDRKEMFLSLTPLIAHVVGSGILFVSLFFFIMSFLSRSITRPIRDLQEGTEVIEKGNFTHKVGTPYKDEIGHLSRTFDKMTTAIRKSYEHAEDKVKQQTKKIQDNAQFMQDQRRALMNVLEDVEEEKLLSQKHEDDLKKFKLAVESSSDHIVITDKEGIILYANPAVTKITGFSQKEVLGKKAGSKELWGGLMNESFYKTLWNAIKSEKKSYAGEIKNRKKSGQIYTSLSTISPVLNEDKSVEFFVGIERDITHEKEVDQAKTEFVSLASHQLRTPLSAISWYAELLMSEGTGNLTREQLQHIGEITKSNRRMIELVNALLNVSRIELGTFMVQPTPTDIVQVVTEVLKEIEQQIKQKGLAIKHSYDKLDKLNVDRKLIRIVFQNLLTNSVKYTPRNGTITIKIVKVKPGSSISGKKVDKASVAISVTDTGMGIPKSQQDKIFTKLFRADNVKEKDTDGTGLGLYIVKSIVDHSGGIIWFDSEAGKGTTFHVLLPTSGMKKRKGTRELETTIEESLLTKS